MPANQPTAPRAGGTQRHIPNLACLVDLRQISLQSARARPGTHLPRKFGGQIIHQYRRNLDGNDERVACGRCAPGKIVSRMSGFSGGFSRIKRSAMTVPAIERETHDLSSTTSFTSTHHDNQIHFHAPSTPHHIFCRLG